jgi:hypothetical protein
MHLPQREDTNAPEHKTSRCTAVEETNQLHNFKQEKNSCLEAKKTRRGFHKLDHPTEDRNGADGSYHLTLDLTQLEQSAIEGRGYPSSSIACIDQKLKLG